MGSMPAGRGKAEDGSDGSDESDGEYDEEKQLLAGHGAMGHVPMGIEDSEDHSSVGAYCKEARRVSVMAAPLVAQNLLTMVLNIVITASVGRLGAQYLAAAVLGTSCYNITGLSMMTGLACGLETLCGQAYGAGEYRQVGVMLQRGVAVNLVAAATVTLGLWVHLEAILVAMGQDPEIARMAARYVHFCIPALVCHALDTCLVRYLVVQGVTKPNMLATGAGTLLAPLYLWYFIQVRGWALDGAAVAFVCCVASILVGNSTIVAVRVLVLKRGREDACWAGWTVDALRGWRGYLRYAVPSWLMVSLEWWCFETLLVLSGLLPNPELAVSAYGILFNIAALCYALPLALLDACITRVSNSLGAQRPLAARTAARASAAVVLASQSCLCVTVLSLRHSVWGLWSAGPELSDLLSKAAVPLALAVVGDGCCCVLAGALRASGRQILGLSLNFCTYWVFGVPFCCALAFGLGWGVTGLWAGLAIVTSLQACALLGIQARTDWQKLAGEAAERVRAGDGCGGPHPGLGQVQLVEESAGGARAMQ